MTIDGRGPAIAGLPADRLLTHTPLAPYSTFKVGGPADWLLLARGAADVRAGLDAARAAQLPVTILGGGSNVLIADSGVRGLVIRVHGGDAAPIGEGLIRADAGLTINGLVRWTVNRGIAGLEAWAGTPGTVGGAIYGNAHFKRRLISELIESVEVVAGDGHAVRIPAAGMEFGYDTSRLQRTREVVLSANFKTSRGDPAALRAIARESLATGSARSRSKRPAPAASSRIPTPRAIAYPTVSRGRPARSSIAPVSREPARAPHGSRRPTAISLSTTAAPAPHRFAR